MTARRLRRCAEFAGAAGVYRIGSKVDRYRRRVRIGGAAAIWTVIYVAPTRSAAEALKERLNREGFLVQLRVGGAARDEGGGPVEVLVPSSEVEEANEVLAVVLGR